MRLKSVFISDYKNLKDFSISFETDGFIDIFVGKNGSGKSNFLEALIEIFDHIYGSKPMENGPAFGYEIKYEIDDKDTCISWKAGQFQINGIERKQLGKTPVPDNIIVYYSGQNDTVANLIRRYRSSYRRKVRGSIIVESPRFIGIGPDYKQLMLAIMLMLPEDTLARRFTCQKLGIEGTGETTTITLQKPSFAKKSKTYDPFNEEELFWGVKGIARDFIDNLQQCITGDFTPGSLFDRDKGIYSLPVDVDKFRKVFADTSGDEIFNLFNALRASNMLEAVAIPVRLANETVVTTRDFSDGQFQSIYIFAISELFKDRQCLTFLDEPDAFLHPEWQFQFLDQVTQISQQATKTNHILMTSHSASTIAAKTDARIHAFEHNGSAINPCQREKSELIKSLSAGLITFSEKEALLGIDNILENTEGAILFVEGITDKIILDSAIQKLFPDENMGFEIQGCFDRGFIRNLFSRAELRDNYPGRKMFALFDFDAAYNDWKSLNQTQMEEDDPFKGLAKQLTCTDHYAMLLPVPGCDAIKRQTLDDDDTPWGGSDCHLSIELLFYEPKNPCNNFISKQTAGGGEIIEFRGDKVAFAKNTICNFEPERFEILRPLFEFIQERNE